MTESREWVAEHAIEFALGALADGEEARFREAAAGDEDFASLLDEAEQDGIGHVPAALLARWESAGRELRGLERQLVMEHAATCASCREELALTGHSAPHPEVERAGRLVRGPWFGGALIGAAATAAFFFFVAPEPVRFHGVAVEVATPRSLRGAGTNTVEIGADDRALLVATSLPIDVAEGAVATLLVSGPDDRIASETALGPAPWSTRSVQVILADDDGIPEGVYEVRMRVEGEDSPRELGRFTVAYRR